MNAQSPQLIAQLRHQIAQLQNQNALLQNQVAQLQNLNAQFRQQLIAAQQVPRRDDSSPVGDFLSGAGQIALGVGGGILAADAIEDISGDLFDDLW